MHIPLCVCIILYERGVLKSVCVIFFSLAFCCTSAELSHLRSMRKMIWNQKLNVILVIKYRMRKNPPIVRFVVASNAIFSILELRVLLFCCLIVCLSSLSHGFGRGNWVRKQCSHGTNTNILSHTHTHPNRYEIHTKIANKRCSWFFELWRGTFSTSQYNRPIAGNVNIKD